MKKVLLTSVCRPLGPAHGDAPSVGYELLHGQVTRAQGLFSPRSLHLHFSLEYIAENLECPCVVLQYPSKAELVRELRKGYDYVCISFLLAVFHRMKEAVQLVRRHAPHTKIVLGGYGTVLPDEILLAHGDHVCRGEGVAFLRDLLGEPPIEMPYRHPLIVSHLRVFGRKVSRTGMIFAGLGCPNGCDFCCTSHFFRRKHLKLLPTGADIHRVVERYVENDPDTSLVVLDEDFLLNRKRAMEFRDCVLRSGRTLSLFVFASIKALSQYDLDEVAEMGIDGVWIGYEGTASNYAKQQGRPPEELFADLKRHGISVLASMILGMPYQTEEIVAQEIDGLMALRPNLVQFLIYGPTPGTPFFERVMQEGGLREELVRDPEEYYRQCDGFSAMVKHPRLSGDTIERLQREAFAHDFEHLGPTLYRSVDTWLRGYETLRLSDKLSLRRKADRFAREIRKSYPIFLTGRLLGPNRTVRRWITALEREVYATLGKPSMRERLLGIAALGAALWTKVTLRFDRFQHPKLTKHAYRLPEESPKLARAWRRVVREHAPLTAELRTGSTVWMRLEGVHPRENVARIAHQIRKALRRTRDRLVLDLERLKDLEAEAAHHLGEILTEYRQRIRILVPERFAQTGVAAALASFGMQTVSIT